MSGYEHLLKKIQSPDVKTRRNAILSIIDITHFDWVRDRDERDIYFALPTLMEALKDDDEEVRKLAIDAIYIEFHEFDKQSVLKLMDPIIEILFDETRQNLHESISHMLKNAVVEGYNITKYISKLINFLSLEGDHPVKLGVVDALTFQYSTQKNWEKVKELMEHQDKEIRQEAVGTLGRYELANKIDLSPIFPSLKKHISDENEEVAFVTARSLIERSQKVEDLSPAIELALKFASSHPDKKLRNNAIAALCKAIDYNVNCNSKLPEMSWYIFVPIVEFFEKKKISHRTLTKYYLHTKKFDKIKSFLTNKSPRIRTDVILELYGCWHKCKIDLDTLIPLLVEKFLKEKNKEVKKVAETRLNDLARRKLSYANLIYNELNKIGYNINKIWRFFEELNKSINQKEIRELENEFNDLKKELKLNKLIEFLEHPNPAIRAWASYQIYILNIYEKCSVRKAIPHLVKKLEDEDFFVREKASAALSYIADKVKIDEAIPYFAKLLHEKIYQIGQHASWGLYRLVQQGKDVSIAIPDLIKLIETDNKEIRGNIKDCLEKYIIDKNKAKELIDEAKKLGKFEQFIEELIEKRKKDLIRLGGLYAKQAWTHKQAIEHYRIYLNIDEENTEVWYNLANLYFKNNCKDEAIQACNRCIKINSEFQKAQKLLKKLNS